MYFDTSALVKLYYPEAESDVLTEFLNSKHEPIPILPIHELELHTAIALKQFRKEISKEDRKQIMKLFMGDIEHGILHYVTPDWAEIYERAHRLADQFTPRYGTRALDLLHIASALALSIREFITFDDKQAKVAKAVGLRTKWN